MKDDKKEYLASMDLKTLRQERKESIDRCRDKVKEQNKIIKAIRQALTEEGRTIPKLAEFLAMDTDTVLVYVSTLKKYGIIGEGPKDGDYFTYQMIK
ncbi:MAG: winged helix-turn-helix domain-containing protein [Pseudomonadota bacterium]